MEDLLGKLVQHSVNYAIRSGIALTTGYAITAGSRLLKSVKGTERSEIADLQARLKSKINIISPPIDMIELIAARGNTTLDSALTLTKQIRMGIQELGLRLNEAATDEEKIRRKSPSAKTSDQMSLELKSIIADMKRLLARIEDAVPLLMLAITTSGASLSTSLPQSISPSRLLQASTFLSAGDANYGATTSDTVQIGPAFVLSVYMLFAAHTLRPQDEEGISETTWKEVIRKARVKLFRVPLHSLYDFPSAPNRDEIPDSSNTFPSQNKAHEFAYQLMIIEDLDDDRFHEEQGEEFEDVARAGIREIIPIHEVSKIFYADTGKILKIGSEGEPNNPILLIKRDVDAVPPRRMMSDDEDESGLLDDELPPSRLESNLPVDTANRRRKNGFPPDLDPEWLALEVYTEAADSESEDEAETAAADEAEDFHSSPPPAARSKSTDFLSNTLAGLRIRSSSANIPSSPPPTTSRAELRSSQMTEASRAGYPATTSFFPTAGLPALRSSLSLLELLIRLTALQQFQQASHLSINDEFLNFFLSGSSSTGAGADSEYRKRIRHDTRLRVGFDPYDESPIKQRGEDYIQNNGHMRHDDGGWHQWEDGPRSSPGLQSPHYAETPSPSLRQHMQQRLESQSGRTRSQQLRQGLEHARSPLGRSESDSTLGTSPRSPALEEHTKR